jgi:hypothetical protein
MIHATACIIGTIHADWALISSIVHINYYGLLARELVKQLINECFYVKYATQVAVCSKGR